MPEYREMDAVLAAVPAKYAPVIRALPAADVVARDCYDRILAENDDLKRILDTYGGEFGIAAAFEAKAKLEAGEVRPVVRGEWVEDKEELFGTPIVRTCCFRCFATLPTSEFVSKNYCPMCGADMRPSAE